MAYNDKTKESVHKLRVSGLSIKEISEKTGVSVGTVSLWVRDVQLDSRAVKRLQDRKEFGYYLTSQRWKKKRKLLIEEADRYAADVLSRIRSSIDLLKVYASIFYWTEGSKTSNHVGFTNSDPVMVRCIWLV